MSDVKQKNNVVGECPVCANDGGYCSNPKCPNDPKAHQDEITERDIAEFRTELMLAADDDGR